MHFSSLWLRSVGYLQLIQHPLRLQPPYNPRSAVSLLGFFLLGVRKEADDRSAAQRDCGLSGNRQELGKTQPRLGVTLAGARPAGGGKLLSTSTWHRRGCTCSDGVEETRI